MKKKIGGLESRAVRIAGRRLVPQAALHPHGLRAA